MNNYYIQSIVSEMAIKVKKLIDDDVITKDKKIVLYGLDTVSFAIRTILDNFDFQVDSYISDNLKLVTDYKRTVKALRARYLNSSRDLIKISSIQERLVPFDERIIVLCGSNNCPKERLDELNYKTDINLFQLFDWENDNFTKAVQGKKFMELNEIQSVEKEILYIFDKFCMDRGLRYWVCGGTLLGTIRHKGFIPWDDDIDVFMPWKDYLEFMDKYKCDDDYSLIVPHKTDRKNYNDIFAKMGDNRTIVRENGGYIRKIHPVAIDIFPLIGIPQEKQLFFSEYKELDKTIIEDFYACNGELEVYNKWYSAQHKFLDRCDFDRSEYVGVVATAYGERDCTTRAVYNETIRMPFEDIEVNVPIGYKEYLDNLYGKGWMELPDESKRNSHHNMEAYWL